MLVLGRDTKNWDRYVDAVDELSASSGFLALRHAILAHAEVRQASRVLDVGAGTGLLALPVAERTPHVTAIDISAAMCERLRERARQAGARTLRVLEASATDLPFEDEAFDIVLSNYCLHELDEHDKLRALSEMHRVLVAGGRLVIGDMMFSLSLAGSARDRALIWSKVRAMLRKGLAGGWRLARNGVRTALGRGERPAPPEWWERALREAGFTAVGVELTEHEGGVAYARRP